MKKVLSRILAVSLVVGLISTTAFAAETVEVDGYGYATGQMSISNVLSDQGQAYMEDGYGTAYPTYICDGEAVVTSISSLFSFDLYKIGIQDGTYTPYETTDYTLSGTCEYYDYTTGAFVTADLNEVSEDSIMSYSGAQFTVTEPGVYYAVGRLEAIAGSCVIVFEIRDSSGVAPVEVLPTLAKEATPTASTIMVDGVDTAFDAYLIEGNNYFKLRDVATALNGSEAQFNVGYENGMITLIAYQAYESVGGEMAAGDGISKNVFLTEDYISLKVLEIDEDGEESLVNYYGFAQPTGYKIDGNNYYQLREIAQLLGFNVSWDSDSQTIIVDSTAEYTAD